MAQLLIKFLFLVILIPAKAGLFSNDKTVLREAIQSQNWEESIKANQALLESNEPEVQKDLYRLAMAMTLFRQAKIDESIEVLQPVTEKSQYYLWAKIFLSRLAYISEDDFLLKDCLQAMKSLEIKGELKLEKRFYEAFLLTQEKKWSEADKILRSLERSSRNSDLYSSILELMANVEVQKIKGKKTNSSKLCKTLKTIYVKYPLHLWIRDSAPELKNISIEDKKISCSVTEKDFEKRRKTLNRMGEFTLASNEVQKWIDLNPSLSEKKKKIILAQQLMSEGHAEDAVQLLEEVKKNSSDIELLSSLSFAAARNGDLKKAIELSLNVYKILGSSKTGTMALYQSAVWSYQIRDYDSAEERFRKIKTRRLSRNYQKEIQWYLAWLRYLKGDYIAAEKSFHNMLRTQSSKGQKINKDRIMYWLAMSLYNRGKTEKAVNLFTKLNSKKGINYYSQLASERLKQISAKNLVEAKINESIDLVIAGKSNYITPYLEEVPQAIENESEAEVADADSNGESEEADTIAEESKSVDEGEEQIGSNQEELFSQNEANLKLDRARAFWSVGLDELARQEVADLEHYYRGFEVFKKIIEEYKNLGLYNKLSSLASAYSNRADKGENKFIFESIYPKAYEDFVEKAAKESNISKSLIWGIMKAESMYRPWVKSPVGAIGLMQVMPTTGYRLAEILDYKDFSPQVLLQPNDAIRFGSKYLERLSKKFDHTIQLVAAAYNAGPHRVSQWLYYFGYMQMDEWVEHIPFLETRNYVKKVTMNYLTYNDLYNLNHLKEDQFSLIGPVPVQVAGAPETKESWE